MIKYKERKCFLIVSRGQKHIKYMDKFVNFIVNQRNERVTVYHLVKINNISIYIADNPLFLF